MSFLAMLSAVARATRAEPNGAGGGSVTEWSSSVMSAAA